MSQHPSVERIVIREQPGNGLGLAGFIISLVGFLGGCFGGALLCPVGLILSAVAMKRPPKGFAIAGLVLGILGSLWLLIGIFFLGGLGLLGVAAASAFSETVRITVVQNAISDYKRETGFLPISLSDIESKYPQTMKPEVTKDIGYRATSLSTFVLTTPGPDHTLGTSDDVEHAVTLDESHVKRDQSPGSADKDSESSAPVEEAPK